jgi:hypothetical protein
MLHLARQQFHSVPFRFSTVGAPLRSEPDHPSADIGCVAARLRRSASVCTRAGRWTGWPGCAGPGLSPARCAAGSPRWPRTPRLRGGRRASSFPCRSRDGRHVCETVHGPRSPAEAGSIERGRELAWLGCTRRLEVGGKRWPAGSRPRRVVRLEGLQFELADRTLPSPRTGLRQARGLDGTKLSHLGWCRERPAKSGGARHRRAETPAEWPGVRAALSPINRQFHPKSEHPEADQPAGEVAGTGPRAKRERPPCSED